MTRALRDLSITIPAKHMRSYKLVQVLLDGPGTFWQVCERAEYGVDGEGEEARLRQIFATMIRNKLVIAEGITYHLSAAARAAMTPPAPYIGQVAGPAYRGTPMAPSIRIVRRQGVSA